MKIANRLHAKSPKDGRDERGAALITTLLTATLLLGIGGVLILTSSMSAVTTFDSTAEAQAYYAAEAGMQEALRVLRGNMPDDGDKNTNEPLDKVNFKEAATPSESNQTDDASTDAGIARLSNWLDYSYQNNEVNERVPLTGGTSYSPIRDLAYSVEILAPDRPVAGATPSPPNSTEENPPFDKNGYSGKDPGTNPVLYPTGRPQDTWHPQHCGHCEWDYTHCGMYNAANPALSGVPGSNPGGCTHGHCFPISWGGSAGTPGDDGYQRLLVKVTGYGPKGAKKEIELLVKRSMFDYVTPAMMYMQGAPSTSMTFDLSGSAKESKFDGKEGISFGFTNYADYDYAVDRDGKGSDTGVFETYKDRIDLKGGAPENVAGTEIPEALSTAAQAREVRAGLRQLAIGRGRFFTASQLPTSIGNATAPELTYVEGDYTLTGSAADGTSHTGLLVVTGKLTLNGAFKFEGLILVLGDAALAEGGVLHVTGSNNENNSKVDGGIALARFGSAGDFLAPTFRIASGKWKVTYNDDLIKTAVNTVGSIVLGVRER